MTPAVRSSTERPSNILVDIRANRIPAFHLGSMVVGLTNLLFVLIQQVKATSPTNPAALNAENYLKATRLDTIIQKDK